MGRRSMYKGAVVASLLLLLHVTVCAIQRAPPPPPPPCARADQARRRVPTACRPHAQIESTSRPCSSTSRTRRSRYASRRVTCRGGRSCAHSRALALADLRAVPADARAWDLGRARPPGQLRPHQDDDTPGKSVSRPRPPQHSKAPGHQSAPAVESPPRALAGRSTRSAVGPTSSTSTRVSCDEQMASARRAVRALLLDAVGAVGSRWSSAWRALTGFADRAGAFGAPEQAERGGPRRRRPAADVR